MKVRKGIVALAGAVAMTAGVGGASFAIDDIGTGGDARAVNDCDNNRIVNNGRGSIINRNRVTTRCSARARGGNARVRF